MEGFFPDGAGRETPLAFHDGAGKPGDGGAPGKGATRKGKLDVVYLVSYDS